MCDKVAFEAQKQKGKAESKAKAGAKANTAGKYIPQMAAQRIHKNMVPLGILLSMRMQS